MTGSTATRAYGPPPTGIVALTLSAVVACSGTGASDHADSNVEGRSPLVAGLCERPPGDAPTPSETPTLAVIVSVDQLAPFLLDRYDTLFTGGLRRLLDRGRNYTLAVHEHAQTSTAPGHATIATGLQPARHRIVANEWFERRGEEWVRVANYEDAKERVVDRPDLPGFSPSVLEGTTIADWLRDTDSTSLAVSLSGKVRTAVPFGGRSGCVLVFDADFGPGFTTSTFYTAALPDWVESFNTEFRQGLLADSLWESTVPPAARFLTRPDTTEFEHRGHDVAFPHSYAAAVRDADLADSTAILYWFEDTPMLDEATLALAEAAVVELDLGRRGVRDLLALGLSATDRIGHYFGPLSREQLDNLLRLDRELGRFFDFLDARVGPSGYVVALTADHGVALEAEELWARGLAGGRIPPHEMWEITQMLVAIDVDSAASDPDLRRVRLLEDLDVVADAMPLSELASDAPADSFVQFYRNSYDAERAIGLARYGVAVRLHPGFIASTNVASHGTAYFYDRHVPFILMGPDIPAETVGYKVRTVDIAPTLAGILGVETPDDLDGRSLLVD